MRMKKAAAKRRPSVKERLRTAQDIATWVDASQPVVPSEQRRVRIAVPDRAESVGSSSSSEDSVFEIKSVPLNGGYGWVIVFYSFCLHFILDGFTFSFGFMFHAMLAKFEWGRVSAGMVASVFMSMPLMLSPIAAAVTDVAGCRSTIMFGGAFGFFGAVLSLWSDTVATFFVTFGVIIGFGMAFLYNAAIVAVTLYFNKKLGRATSFAISGTGVGTLFFSKIIGLVVKLSGLEPTQAVITLMAGLMLVVIFIGFVMVEVAWTSDTPQYKEKWFNKHIDKHDLDERSMHSTVAGMDQRRAYSLPGGLNAWEPAQMESGSSVRSVKDAATWSSATRSRSVGMFAQRSQLPPVPEYSMINSGDLGHLEHLDLQMTSSPSNTVRSRPRYRMISKTSMSASALNDMDDEEVFPFKMSLETSSDSDSHTEESDSEMSNDGDSSSSDLSDRCLNKERRVENGVGNGVAPAEVNGQVNFKQPASRASRPSVSGMNTMTFGRVPACNAIAPKPRYNTNMLVLQGKMTSAPTLEHQKKQWYQKTAFSTMVVDIAKSFVNQEIPNYKKVLKQPEFLLFILSTMALYLVLDVPYVFFFDHSVANLKVESDTAEYVVSLIGLANLISTWIMGAVSDKAFFKKRMYYIYAAFMMAVALGMFAAAFVDTFIGMGVVAFTFGLFISANYVLQSVLIADQFPVTNSFMSAYALCSCCEGWASLIGPPIMGFVRDSFGSYKLVFVISGIFVTISAILAFRIQSIVNKKESRKCKSTNEENEKDVEILLSNMV